MYTEVNLEIIEALKERDYKSVRFILQSSDNKTLAIVEVIPGREDCIQFDQIPLNSAEILDYFDQPTPMAKYVIDQKHLTSWKWTVKVH